jgi:GNAT superfamily N-acetyltransferase
MLQIGYFGFNRNPIGNSRVFVQDNKAHLAFMEIFPVFQRQGYGSKLLSETENILRRQFDTYQVSLLAWQPYSSQEVVDFYKKNGYLISNYQTDVVYDDSTKMWDLVKMHKILKPTGINTLL